MRVVSVAYLALAAAPPEPAAGSHAAEARWEPVGELLSRPKRLAFDRDRFLMQGLRCSALTFPSVFQLVDEQSGIEAHA
jgi:ADP-ribose pyrophosphatase YjhB (NUDIX family)